MPKPSDNLPSGATRLTLRLLDLAFSIPLALLALPMYALARLIAPVEETWRVGRQGKPFRQRSLRLGKGPTSRLLRRLRIHRAPVLWNVLAGDMSWVGPRALGIDEPTPPDRPAICSQLRPGIFSLWTLRQRTSIDYEDEGQCDAELLRQLTAGRWLGILLRNLLASLYGRTPVVADNEPRLVDTVRVHPLSMTETLDALEKRLADGSREPLHLCFVNPDCVNQARRNAAYRRTLNQADLVVPDGIGMRLAGRLLGHGFRQNVNGTDLFPRLIQRLGNTGHRLYLLGGRPGIAEATAEWARQACPTLAIAGHHHGFFASTEEAQIIADIRASQADVLLLGLGAPRQELWIAENARACGVKVAMGVGGLFDFYAGRIPRAPQWLRELGLEWTWRLYQEPGRMWRRYLIGNLSFLIAVAMQRWVGSADAVKAATEEPAQMNQPLARHAVLFADIPGEGVFLPGDDNTPVLLPLGDRSLLHRSLDVAAGHGCKQVTVLASRGLSSLRAALGSGERWGLTVNLCGIGTLQDARRRVQQIPLEPDECLLIGRMDHLLPVEALNSQSANAVWVYLDDDNQLNWAGWALVGDQSRGDWLNALSASGLLTYRLPEYIERLGAPPPTRFDRPDLLLEAQSRWLSRDSDGFDLYREIEPGIRVAASARIGRGVQWQAPVEIGDHCVIEAGARIGPNVVVGDRCTIGSDVELRDSLVDTRVVLSGDLHVEQSIVVPDGLFNQRHGSWIPSEAIAPWVGVSKATKDQQRVTLDERLMALSLILVAALPVAFNRLRGKSGTFSQAVYPRLFSVVVGRMALFGPNPKSPMPETLQLAGWQEQLCAARPALLRPADALGLDDVEAAAWADLHWLLNPSAGERRRLLKAYLQRIRRPGVTVEPQSDKRSAIQ
ncbi:MAG: WecB/TagA/CpsF family glycosyltransferase [Wenzhouxiangella sp.]